VVKNSESFEWRILMMDNLVEQLAERQNEVVALLRQLVELESPSNDKAAIDRLGAFIVAQLRDVGASVEVAPQTDAGDHVVATFGSLDTAPIVTMCHIDTVWPLGTLAKMPWREENGKLRGPGVYDMKASTAMLLTVLRHFRDTKTRPTHPLRMLFTTDEETGSATSRALIEAEAKKAALVLCLEPALSNGALKTFRKGTGGFTVTAFGRAAHAGADHARGVNAIEEIARQVTALHQMTNYELGTTVNVGVVSGGTVSNVVPDRAQIEVDVRVATVAEGERMVQAILKLEPHLPGARLEVTGGLNRPPMERTGLIVETFQRAKSIAANIGLDLQEGSTGGASDANFTAALGVPTLDGLGAVGNGGHSVDEHVVASMLPERTALLAALLTQW
jgi:glutamate carboxypeptidase